MISDASMLREEIERLSSFISREEGKKEKIQEQLIEAKVKVEKIQIDLELLEKVTILFQKTSEFAREQAKSQIETIVTKCLQFVFETDIRFVVEIEELRNKANAEFYVISDVGGITIKTKPELSRGGGIVDVVSLALRIAFLQIHKPGIQGPLILDEPAKHVSEDYIFNIGDFLKHTSEMFNRQIIMVTHNQHLAEIGANSHRVGLIGNMSIIEKIQV